MKSKSKSKSSRGGSTALNECQNVLPGTPQAQKGGEDRIAAETQRQLEAQQKRIARFSEMLNEFRDHKVRCAAETVQQRRKHGITTISAESTPDTSPRSSPTFDAADAASSTSATDGEMISTITEFTNISSGSGGGAKKSKGKDRDKKGEKQQKPFVVTKINVKRGAAAGTDVVQPLTRSNIFAATSAENNPLNRTPISMPRIKAWKLSGLDRPQLNGQVRRRGPNATPGPVQRVHVAGKHPATAVEFDIGVDAEVEAEESMEESIRKSAELLSPEPFASAANSPVKVDVTAPARAPPLAAEMEASAAAAAAAAPAEDIYVEVCHVPTDTQGEYVEVAAEEDEEIEPVYMLAGPSGPAANTVPEYILAGPSGILDSDDEDEDEDECNETGQYANINSGSPDLEEASYGTYGTMMAEEFSSEMHAFAANGNVPSLALKIRDGCSINAVDETGRTLLMYSLKFGMIECSKWIVARGADVNMATAEGATALHYAALDGTNADVKLLLDSGADHRLADNELRLPLHWAMSNSSTHVLETLVSVSTAAEINAADCTGLTPAMWAAFYGNKEHLLRLQAAGADLHTTKDESGKSAIHLACQPYQGSCGALKVLLNYQSSFAQCNAGRSAVHYAAEVGNKKAIKRICAVRPQAVHDIDSSGRTPLHWAAACNHEHIVLKLLKYSAHPSRADNDGKTACDYARALGYTVVVAAIEAFVAQQREEGTQPRLGPASASTSSRSFEEDGAMKVMSDEARNLLKMLASGSCLYKFAKGGSGPLQQRYFWIDLFSGELCWTKSLYTLGRKDGSQVSSAQLKKVKAGSSAAVKARSDYDGVHAHKYGFTLVCKSRSVDVIAPSAIVYNIWVDGLQCLRRYATEVAGVDQKKVVASVSAESSDC